MQSMTAYGKAAQTTPHGSWVVEIHSVNRKMLDFHIYLPRELLFLDTQLRKHLSQSVFRGQVTVRVTAQRDEKGILRGEAEALKELKKEWDAIARALGLDPSKEVSLEFLVSQHGQMAVPAGIDTAALENSLMPIVDEALKEFHAMRRAEGKALEKDIRERCRSIEAALGNIQLRTGDAASAYRARLIERVAAAGVENLDPDRIAREVVLFVDKVDITEELTRLKSHLQQFLSTMDDKAAKGVGRTLDFIVQEMGRELNTIAAKSNDMEIAKDFIAARSELEKIREQIQNIE
jgi:uncharacterized protein (TIGR00255 family)